MIGSLILATALVTAPAGHSVTVQQGNTLSGIAATYEVPGGWQAVYAANEATVGTDPNIIYPGEVLAVPGPGEAASATGEAPAPATSPSSIAGAYSSTGGSSVPAWATCIVQRESGGNPAAVNSVPGYVGNGGGLFGDLTSTWGGYDGYAQPFDAPASVQIQFNDQLEAQMGLSPWAADQCPGT
jgi:LysM repeat protein